MADPTYVVGSLVVVSATFLQNGVPADPGGLIVLTYRDPTNVVTSIAAASLTHTPGTGAYSYNVDTTGLPGRWTYRFQAGPGAGQAAQEGEFIVTPSLV